MKQKIYRILFSPLLLQLFLLFLFFIKANPFLNSKKIILGLMGVSVVWGAIFSIYVIIKNRKELLRNKYAWVLLAFIVSYLITIIANYPNSFVDNVKDVIWFSVQIIALFLAQFYILQEQKDNNVKLLAKFYLAFATVFASISLIFVFINKGGVESYGKWGFLSKRLFGLYRSPNYGALYCVIAIIIAAGIYTSLSKQLKCFAIFNVLVNYLYIVYSGSNTGKVTLFTGIIVFACINILSSDNRKQLATKMLAYTVVIVFCFSMFPAIKFVTANILNSKISRHETDSDMSESALDSDGDDYIISFERTDYVEGEEYGNGRLTNWKNSIKVFHNKAVFGTSLRAYNTVSNNLFPDSPEYKKVFSLENDFMSLLVCCGITGLVVFVLFILLSLCRLITILYSLLKNKEYKKLEKLSLPFAIISLVTASAFFTDAIVFTNVLQSMIFWIFLGYLLSYKYKQEENS